jgi:hypothetical protein
MEDDSSSCRSRLQLQPQAKKNSDEGAPVKPKKEETLIEEKLKMKIRNSDKD